MVKGILKNTKFFRNFWKKRVIDWTQAYFTPDHPHRKLIVEAVRDFRVLRSILEIGCASGANLYAIKRAFPHVDVGGIDWSQDAIDCAKKMLPFSSVLQVGEATDIYLSDKGTDIGLTDMCLIYLDKNNFRQALKELKRISREGIILCEFHSSNWVLRNGLKFTTGYNAYDYEKELTLAGFHDIQFKKLTEQDWPGGEPQKTFGYLITARS